MSFHTLLGLAKVETSSRQPRPRCC